MRAYKKRRERENKNILRGNNQVSKALTIVTYGGVVVKVEVSANSHHWYIVDPRALTPKYSFGIDLAS